MKNDSCIFEDLEIQLTKTHTKLIEDGTYSNDHHDIKSNKSRNKYNSYINKIIRFQPKEYFQESFDSIEYEMILKICLYTLKKIFPNEELITDEFIEFMNCICLSNNNSILSGSTCYISTLDKTKFFVEIPNLENTSSVVALIHEFLHYFSDKYNLDLNKKCFYREILSIYAEKIACYYLEKLGYKVVRNVEETRLEGIVWHYTTSIEDYTQLMKLYKKRKASAKTVSDFLDLSRIESQAPFLCNPEFNKQYLRYKSDLKESYGIGYLYAEYLFQLFLEQNETNNKIKDVLSFNTKLQDALNYYNINCENYQVYQAVEQKIKTLRP